jgi:hypothetical protein
MPLAGLSFYVVVHGCVLEAVIGVILLFIMKHYYDLLLMLYLSYYAVFMCVELLSFLLLMTKTPLLHGKLPLLGCI